MKRYWLTFAMAVAACIVARADEHDIAPLALRWVRNPGSVAGPTAGMGVGLLCLLAADGMRLGRTRLPLGLAGILIAWGAWVALAAPSDVLSITLGSSIPFLAASVAKLMRVLKPAQAPPALVNALS